jgi:hypothetical protein
MNDIDWQHPALCIVRERGRDHHVAAYAYSCETLRLLRET